jgi:hypothetical protein
LDAQLGYFYSSTGIGLFLSRFGGVLFQYTNKLIPEQVFFHLEKALYRSTGDSLRSMPANVIEFIFFDSLDFVLLFNLYNLPW